MKKILFYILLAIAVIVSDQSYGQLSQGGEPMGFSSEFNRMGFQEYDVEKPDFETIFIEDKISDSQGLPPRFAQGISVKLNPGNSGTWFFHESGFAIWRLGLRAEGALAISLNFKDFELPEDAELFIYSADQHQLIGAFTSTNNRVSGQFATALIDGDQCIIELNVPNVQQSITPFTLTEVNYAYRYAGDDLINANGSDYCEVNVNCSPEGDIWQNQKRSVVRIQVKVSSSTYWCTGSLINNSNFDQIPYILTADHCAFQLGGYASPSDLEDWIFYFNYEGLFCESNNAVPGYLTMVGATKIAQGGDRGSTGSDFYLVKLIDDIPGGSSVYFNGWTAVDIPVDNGVTIHHPDGDIKKISTFTEPLVTSSWAGNGLNSHWKVVWTETLNGWGVTEGGSSGSPILDANGRIVGTLTGGLAACDAQGSIGPDKPDYYGKFSYHWESNGTADTAQLKPWLDPNNSGVLFLAGFSTAIQENFNGHQSIKIFPNPLSTFLNLEFTTFAPGDFEITIINLLGQTVYQEEFILNENRLQIALEELNAGTYFLKANFNQHTETHKILIR